jgi:hypothetical protein
MRSRGRAAPTFCAKSNHRLARAVDLRSEEHPPFALGSVLLADRRMRTSADPEGCSGYP